MSDSTHTLLIREMTMDDLPAVTAAERECFPEEPWGEADFRHLIEQPHCRGLVVVCGAEIVGYLLAYEVVDEGELINIGVVPRERGQRIGSQLLKHWLDFLRSQAFVAVFLEVRMSNVPAIALYEAQGFERTGMRKKYYADGEDALTMMATLSG